MPFQSEPIPFITFSPAFLVPQFGPITLAV